MAALKGRLRRWLRDLPSAVRACLNLKNVYSQRLNALEGDFIHIGGLRRKGRAKVVIRRSAVALALLARSTLAATGGIAAGRSSAVMSS